MKQQKLTQEQIDRGYREVEPSDTPLTDLFERAGIVDDNEKIKEPDTKSATTEKPPA